MVQSVVILLCLTSVSKAQDYARYVNPFIGTGKSDMKTKWGNYGGTYPGAVCPWGMVQLSPETSLRPDETGYYYEDTVIRSFSSIAHKSGYPNGSSGRVHFIFKPASAQNSLRRFNHNNETAVPGYYGVRFDEGDRVEMTVTPRTGMYKYTPTASGFSIGIFNAGKLTLKDNRTLYCTYAHAVIQFSEAWSRHEQRGDTTYFIFAKASPVLIKIAVSSVGFDASYRNLKAENPAWDFEKIREGAYKQWDRELSVISIQASTDEKTKFYTALYHSLLLPWIVSDADGKYMGADKKVHESTGKQTYGAFSPWDTFRTLHPLLALLKPHVLEDMLHSVVDYYSQSGSLPHGPMTGFHIIPVLLDAYVKGINTFDTAKMYEAMQHCLLTPDKYYNGIQQYITKGFLCDSIEKSVSVTLEFAYNDWAFARFASLLHHSNVSARLFDRSFNYRNLLDMQTMFMLPRNNNGFNRAPGEMGYQESDKWTTSFFVPHNIQDMINLMGGDSLFIHYLNKGYQSGNIIHDNEPVFHYPYLYSYAGQPLLTSQKVREILKESYRNTPGGITGNDDLGSMSSWYVFSSMGLFPACPGTTEYMLTTPLFEKTQIRLSNGKQMTLHAKGDMEKHMAALRFNEAPYKRLFIRHEDMMKGGTLEFILGDGSDFSDYVRPYSLTKDYPVFETSMASISRDFVYSNDPVRFDYTLHNKGSEGSKQINVFHNHTLIASKMTKVGKDHIVRDSLSFKLYPEGNQVVEIDGKAFSLYVKDPQKPEQIICTNMATELLVKSGDSVACHLTYQNISGKTATMAIPVYLNNQLLSDKEYSIGPGAYLSVKINIRPDKRGFYTIKSLNREHRFKIYDTPMDSKVLHFDFETINEHKITDHSGFHNDGTINGSPQWVKHRGGYAMQTGRHTYLSLPVSQSLMYLGNTLSMAIWMCPMKEQKGYVDFFTKGDYTLLKMENPQTLTFFAGGWGRGSCQVTVPDNWYGNWHHVAGVCTGNFLELYIDGVLQQRIAISGNIDYTEVPWNIGRNAEMPYSRFFDGLIDDLYLFKEPLSATDVKTLFDLGR